MKKLLILLSAILVLSFMTSCKQEPTELYINSEFSEVTMKNVYGQGRNVARAILDNAFATNTDKSVSFILPEKWREYGSRIQVQTIEGGLGVYALADGYDLKSDDFSPYYADLFAIIYVPEKDSTALLTKYGEYFEKSRYLGYMDDTVCYLLYNEKINTERSPEFTDEEQRELKKFLKVCTVIDEYIILSANE